MYSSLQKLWPDFVGGEMRTSHELRVALQKELEKRDLSLRQGQELIGVSFSTLSRFLRGGKNEMTVKNLERIDVWLNGGVLPKKKQAISRRFNFGKQSFLITIEALKE